MLTEQKAGEILVNVAPNIIHVVEYLQENGIKRLEDIQEQNLEELPKLHVQLITLMRIAIKGAHPELTSGEAMQIIETVFLLSTQGQQWPRNFYADMLKKANREKK